MKENSSTEEQKLDDSTSVSDKNEVILKPQDKLFQYIKTHRVSVTILSVILLVLAAFFIGLSTRSMQQVADVEEIIDTDMTAAGSAGDFEGILYFVEPIEVYFEEDLEELPAETPEGAVELIKELIAENKEGSECLTLVSISKVSGLVLAGGVSSQGEQCGGGAMLIIYYNTDTKSWVRTGTQSVPLCDEDIIKYTYYEFIEQCYSNDESQENIDNPNGYLWNKASYAEFLNEREAYVEELNKQNAIIPKITVDKPTKGQEFGYFDASNGWTVRLKGKVTPGSMLDVDVRTTGKFSSNFPTSEYIDDIDLDSNGNFDFTYTFMSWGGSNKPDQRLTFTVTSSTGNVTTKEVDVRVVPGVYRSSYPKTLVADGFGEMEIDEIAYYTQEEMGQSGLTGLPGDGRVLVVGLNIKNTSGRDVTYSYSDFTLVGLGGSIYNALPDLNTDARPSGQLPKTIANGGSFWIYMVFDTPQIDGAPTVRWDYSQGLDNPAEYTLVDVENVY